MMEQRGGGHRWLERARRDFAAARDEAVRAQEAVPPRERIEASMRLGAQVRWLMKWGRGNDRPWALHERARDRGMLDD